MSWEDDLLSVIRAFIAFDLSDEIYKRVEIIIQDLKTNLQGMPIRWVPVENIHLTIKFLGDVSIANLEMLENILRSEGANHHPIEISVGELGAFPSFRRPRVIWCGVEAPPELGEFQKAIETETARLGYPREDRPFSPHLTLGRVARNAHTNQISQIGEIISQNKVGFLGATRLSEIHLYRSDLQPSGAQYTRLFSAELSSSGHRGQSLTKSN